MTDGVSRRSFLQAVAGASATAALTSDDRDADPHDQATGSDAGQRDINWVENVGDADGYHYLIRARNDADPGGDSR